MFRQPGCCQESHAGAPGLLLFRGLRVARALRFYFFRLNVCDIVAVTPAAAAKAKRSEDEALWNARRSGQRPSRLKVKPNVRWRATSMHLYVHSYMHECTYRCSCRLFIKNLYWQCIPYTGDTMSNLLRLLY